MADIKVIRLSENTLLETTRRQGIDTENQQKHQPYPLGFNASHVDADEFGIAESVLDEGSWVRPRKHQQRAPGNGLADAGAEKSRNGPRRWLSFAAWESTALKTSERASNVSDQFR